MTRNPPPEIPQYRFLHTIGRGGFSEVHLYEATLLEREVAVKVMDPDRYPDGTAARLLIDEAQRMAVLADHPAVVPVYEADISADGRAYVVMAYYPGGSLRDRMRLERIDLASALDWTIRIGGALATAHTAGIVHGDVKPSNVLLSRFGVPGLIDFGHGGLGDELAQVSLPWAAPELLRAELGGPTEAADVFGLAVTLWGLLAGHSPYVVIGARNDAAAVMRRALHGVIPPLGRPEVSPALEDLIRRCLDGDPDRRPAGAQHLSQLLQAAQVDHRLAPTTLLVRSTEDPREHRGPAAVPANPTVASPSDDRSEYADLFGETLMRDELVPPVRAAAPAPARATAPAVERRAPAIRVRGRRAYAVVVIHAVSWLAVALALGASMGARPAGRGWIAVLVGLAATFVLSSVLTVRAARREAPRQSR